MKQPNEHDDPVKNNHLAEFTNQVLDGNTRQPASHSDDELLGLEETILRLNDAFPPAAFEDAKTKQMLVRFKTRVRREEQKTRQSFWQRLFDIQSDPQTNMVFAVIAVAVLIFIGVSSLEPADTSMAGTAFPSSSLIIGGALIGVLLVIYWIVRRK